MRKRDRLIPSEKSKKVILLDKRGMPEERKSPMAFVLGALGLACIIYCLVIAFFMGYGSRFFLVWGVMGVFFGLWAFLLLSPNLLKRIPKFLKRLFLILFIIGLGCFCGIEAMILSHFGAKPSSGADYVIVLGAQWKTSGPSYVLQKRLDAAVKYLYENPDTVVIVSGGQGSNEPISEAQGMKEYLMSKGIEETRILMEDTSTNTYENLINSSSLLDKQTNRVVLVTNNFHVFRASSIARHQGYVHLEGLAADSYPAMLPNNLLREFVGVIKDTLVGNM